MIYQFQIHHIFPQKPSLQPTWQRLGVEIHDPRFLQYWSTPSHQQRSGTEINGKMILEIPDSNRNFAQLSSYINIAKSYGIEIRLSPE